MNDKRFLAVWGFFAVSYIAWNTKGFYLYQNISDFLLSSALVGIAIGSVFVFMADLVYRFFPTNWRGSDKKQNEAASALTPNSETKENIDAGGMSADATNRIIKRIAVSAGSVIILFMLCFPPMQAKYINNRSVSLPHKIDIKQKIEFIGHRFIFAATKDLPQAGGYVAVDSWIDLSRLLIQIVAVVIPLFAATYALKAVEH